MKYQATKKVTGGKLVRVKIETVAGGFPTGAAVPPAAAGSSAHETIDDIQVSGDFFLHPEEAIEYVQERLRGLSSQSSIETLTKEIEKSLADKKAAFIGMTPGDLAATINDAFNQG